MPTKPEKLVITVTVYEGHIDNIGPVKGRVVVDLLKLPWIDWPKMPIRSDMGLPWRKDES